MRSARLVPSQSILRPNLAGEFAVSVLRVAWLSGDWLIRVG